MSEDKYIIDNEQEFRNLEMGYEQIKTMYAIQLERLKVSDEKLNMVLFFNASILALLIAVLPFDFNSKVHYVLSLIFFVIFILSMILTVVFIFTGLFPRKVNRIDSKHFINPSTYHCDSEKFMGKFMRNYHCSIQSIQDICKRKHKMNKRAMIFTMINLTFIVALIIIKII